MVGSLILENSRGRQCVRVHVSALLAAQIPAPNEAVARPTDTSKRKGDTPLFPAGQASPIQRLQGRAAVPPVERLTRQRSRPCRRIEDGPRQAAFPGFRLH